MAYRICGTSVNETLPGLPERDSGLVQYNDNIGACYTTRDNIPGDGWRPCGNNNYVAGEPPAGWMVNGGGDGWYGPCYSPPQWTPCGENGARGGMPPEGWELTDAGCYEYRMYRLCGNGSYTAPIRGTPPTDLKLLMDNWGECYGIGWVYCGNPTFNNRGTPPINYEYDEDRQCYRDQLPPALCEPACIGQIQCGNDEDIVCTEWRTRECEILPNFLLQKCNPLANQVCGQVEVPQNYPEGYDFQQNGRYFKISCVTTDPPRRVCGTDENGRPSFGECPPGYVCTNTNNQNVDLGIGSPTYECLKPNVNPCTNEFIRCDGENGLYYSGQRNASGECETIYVANDSRCFLPPTPTPTPTPPPTLPPPPPPTPTPTPTPTWRSCIDGSVNNGTAPSGYRQTLYPGAGTGTCWEPVTTIAFEPELTTSLKFLYKRGTSKYPEAVTIKVSNPSYANSYRISFDTNPDILITPKSFTITPRSTQSIIVNVTPTLYEKLGDGLSNIGLNVEISEV